MKGMGDYLLLLVWEMVNDVFGGHYVREVLWLIDFLNLFELNFDFEILVLNDVQRVEDGQFVWVKM